VRRAVLLGHRGARARAPENTFAAFRRALSDGAAGFEFDVRVTRDGVPVLLHDERLDRTTGAKGPLAEFDRADLRELDAGAHFSEEYSGEPLPDLAQVLDEFLGRVTLAMELKEPLPSAALDELAARLERFEKPELLIASFRPDALAPARARLPGVPRALILRLGQAPPAEAMRDALGLWGVFAREESIDGRFADRCRGARLALFAYTVNDPARAEKLAAHGVEGFISDDPGAIRSALDRLPAR
jgi:glycerophosphoryl diester phosphodiesterase